MVKLLFNPFSVVLATLLCLLALYSLRQSTTKTQISTEDIRVLDQEVSKLTSEVSGLESQVEQTQNSFYTEKNIRNELLLQKPGEYVIQIPELKAKTLPSPTPQPSPSVLEQWEKVLF